MADPMGLLMFLLFILVVGGWCEKLDPAACRSKAFVKGDRPKQFPNLEIKYVRGSDPYIHLLNDRREVVETLSIEKWNTDSVEEFLNEHLKK